MKYRKNEAKEAAKSLLKGVWTALPTNFTDDDRLDEKATAANLDYCISDLKMEGHYCIGNVADVAKSGFAARPATSPSSGP